MSQGCGRKGRDKIEDGKWRKKQSPRGGYTLGANSHFMEHSGFVGAVWRYAGFLMRMHRVRSGMGRMSEMFMGSILSSHAPSVHSNTRSCTTTTTVHKLDAAYQASSSPAAALSHGKPTYTSAYCWLTPACHPNREA